MKIIKIGKTSGIANERIYIEIDLNPRLTIKNGITSNELCKGFLSELKAPLKETIDSFLQREKDLYEATIR
jgi:hypothetical protein